MAGAHGPGMRVEVVLGPLTSTAGCHGWSVTFTASCVTNLAGSTWSPCGNDDSSNPSWSRATHAPTQVKFVQYRDGPVLASWSHA